MSGHSRQAGRHRPIIEPLEGRLVLSHAPTGAGAGAILGALAGGAGSEFVTLIRREVPNPSAVLGQFATGRRTEIDIKGFSAKLPGFLPTFQGPHLDQFDPTAAGALILGDGRLELAAILRGPIHLPVATTFNWGIDRGAGTSDPQGLGLPSLRYDAVVSVTRSDTAVGASVTDLRTGVTTPIDAGSVSIQGPTIRVFLANPTASLPSTGQPTSSYRFAFWTSDGSGGPASVGGIVPGSGTLQVGSLARPSHHATRR